MRTSLLVLVMVCVSAPAQAQRPTRGDDDSAALVSEGRAALRRGALDQATSALDQAIVLNPRRVEAYVLRAAVHAARAQYAAGIALLRRAEALAPADEDVRTALGAQLVLSGDRTAGVPLLAQVVAGNPARYDAAQLLGHHLYTTGAWAEAITMLELYFTHRPRALAGEDARHRGDLADAYLRSGQPRQALATFREAAREDAASRGRTANRGAAREGQALRLRIGIAWATAALDCAQARPLLRALAPVTDAQPDIGLVDGQCALVLGDTAGALARGRAYLAQARGPGAAAGHALVGEVLARRGQLVEARRELELARTLEPARRRWSVRLAAVLRRAGDPRAALAVLEPLGPPATPAADAAWWTELGEALLAIGDAPAVITRLGPALSALPRDAAIRSVVGAAQLAAGQGEAAVATLGEADAIASTPRTRQQLAAALATVAVGLLANDPAAAAPLLVRASQLDASAVILRDLGIAQLALGRPAEAVTTLERAVRIAPTPIHLMLAARAHALAGQIAAARPRYERAMAGATAASAVAVEGAAAVESTTSVERIAAVTRTAAVEVDAVEVGLDWAASELAAGEPSRAVAALERGAPRGNADVRAARHAHALAEARHAAGVAALRAGDASKAVVLLDAAIRAAPSRARRCDLALATVVAGDLAAARPALAAVAGAPCPFATGEAIVLPILSAFVDGLTPRRAGPAIARLRALTNQATGPAARLLATAIRVVALEAAADAYRGGRIAAARTWLATAQAAGTRVGGDELAHDQAVLDVADGKLAAAIAALERLAPRLPEALITLGVAHERSDAPAQAAEAWRQARKAGVRFAPLVDWIEAKERVHGAPGAPP